jgi:hypothetical protein
MADDGRVAREYSGFRGADFRGEEINLVRSPDCLNVWKDYKETESIRTRPALQLMTSFTDTVWGVFFFTVGNADTMIVHSGTKLYKVVNDIKTVLYSGVNNAVSNSFIYNNKWYFKDGKNYLEYDGQTISDVEGYVPTTSIGRKASGGGTIHEDVNLLSDYRINTFLADGESKDFYLDAKNIDDGFLPEVKVNDKKVSNYTVDYLSGKISFTEPPSVPLTDGQDNVWVKFKKTVTGYADKIKKCTLLEVFDNRVFFSGNKDFPNMIWHCSLNDPSYCSDLDYYNEGLDTARVKGLVAGNNVLWAFKEPSQANTTVFYHTPTIDAEYGKIYPNTHSSISTGCVGKAINFNDDIIFFSDRGMEGISGDVTTEQVIAHRSSLVDRKLIAEPNYQNMILAEWEGYLIAFIDNKGYLADSRATFTNENHFEYEWFYWELDKTVKCVKVNNGVLYIGTEDGVYTLTDLTSDVESYWVTPKDRFKYPQYQKTTNKRGCVVEAIGDISVYAKTDKTDFELIGDYENVTDYFVCRIKRKKFKDIQLKFHSKTRFSLETATLECFIGGYIKR